MTLCSFQKSARDEDPARETFPEEFDSVQTVIRETVRDLEQVDRHIERLTGEGAPLNFLAYSGR